MTLALGANARPAVPNRESVQAVASAYRIAPGLAVRCELLRYFCDLAGYTFRITDGLRSDAVQDNLYAQGRTKPGSIVTNARAGQSKHNSQGRGYAVAVDIYCTDPARPNRTPAEVTSEVAQLGIALGLSWGGNWTGAAAKALGDIWHLELRTL